MFSAATFEIYFYHKARCFAASDHYMFFYLSMLSPLTVTLHLIKSSIYIFWFHNQIDAIIFLLNRLVLIFVFPYFFPFLSVISPAPLHNSLLRKTLYLKNLLFPHFNKKLKIVKNQMVKIKAQGGERKQKKM